MITFMQEALVIPFILKWKQGCWIANPLLKLLFLNEMLNVNQDCSRLH